MTLREQFIVESRDDDGTVYDWCQECGYSIDSITHAEHCAVGIALTDEEERVRIVRRLLVATQSNGLGQEKER